MAVSAKAMPGKAGNPVLSRVIRVLDMIVNPFGKGGVIISGTILTAMMSLTFIDVAGRYLLNKPVSGSMELTEFMMGIMVAFALGWCAIGKGHIRVDLIFQYTSKKVGLIFDVLNYLMSGTFYALIIWHTWVNAFAQRQIHLTSSVWTIPVYPFVFLLVLGAALVCLVFLKNALESINEVIKQ